MALVAGIHIPVLAFNLSTVGSPWLMSCESMGWKVSALTPILQRLGIPPRTDG